MTDFLNHLRLIQTILRKCTLATASQDGQTVPLPLYFLFFKTRSFKGACEAQMFTSPSQVLLGSNRTEHVDCHAVQVYSALGLSPQM